MNTFIKCSVDKHHKHISVDHREVIFFITAPQSSNYADCDNYYIAVSAVSTRPISCLLSNGTHTINSACTASTENKKNSRRKLIACDWFPNRFDIEFSMICSFRGFQPKIAPRHGAVLSGTTRHVLSSAAPLVLRQTRDRKTAIIVPQKPQRSQWYYDCYSIAF